MWENINQSLYTKKTSPITLPNGRAKGCLCKDFVDNWPPYSSTALVCNITDVPHYISHRWLKPWTIMMTSSNGNIFRVTGPLCGEFTGPGEFPTQRPVTRSFDVFFDLRLNKRLSKQPWGWWFETLSWSLWHHCNDHMCNDKSWSIVMLIRFVTLFSHGIGVSYSITLLSFSEMGYHISNKIVDFVDDN